MPLPADLAIISAGAPRLGRAIKTGEIEQWRLRDCRLALLPLRVKDGPAALQRGLNAACHAGCRIAALPAKDGRTLSHAPLLLTDGRLFALSALPRRLDLDCPGWRKDQACLNADDAFSCLAARLLAPYVARLHVFGADAERREKLMRLLFRESGLIASGGPTPVPDSLIIAPPQDSPYGAGQQQGSYIWRRWPREATTAESNLITVHLAEALLLCAGGLPENTALLPLLSLLRRRGYYYEILPQ